MKIDNEKDVDVSIFNLNVFNEKHLEKNPYSEITHGDGGRVLFDTSEFKVTFDPIDIKSTF